METDLIRKARGMHSNYLDDKVQFSCRVHVAIEGKGHQLDDWTLRKGKE